MSQADVLANVVWKENEHMLSYTRFISNRSLLLWHVTLYLLLLVNSDARADEELLRQRVEHLYAQMDEATSRGDTKTFASLFDEKYELFTTKTVSSKRNVVEKFNALVGAKKREFKTTVLSLKITGDQAIVDRLQVDKKEVYFSVLEPEAETGPIFWKFTDILDYTDDKWVLIQSRQTGFGVILHGKLKNLAR